MILYNSNYINNPKNCIYPNKIDVTDSASFITAVSQDYVCACYTNNYRSNDNFKESDCIMLDCDNTHSENPDEWITADKVIETFDGVALGIHFSKNNNKVKNNKPARPKFHVVFQSSVITSGKEHSGLKKKINEYFPYFDTGALDAARFFYGTSPTDVIFINGVKTINDFLDDVSFEKWENFLGEIAEGGRNNTMSHIAGKLVMRFGYGDDAFKMFLEQAEKCNPPLADDELQKIWYSAINFGKKVALQEGYIPPEKYNLNVKLKPLDFSDVDQARVFAREYMDRIAFTPSTDYLVYNGSFWEESKEMAQGLAQELTDRQLEEAKAEIKRLIEEMKKNGAWVLIEELGEKKAVDKFNDAQLIAYRNYEKAENYRKYAVKRRGSREIANTTKEAKPMLLLPHSILDNNEFLLNTPNHTVNLKTREIKEHDPFDYITKQTTLDPSDVGMKAWLSALDTIFESDAEVIEYVQRIVGLGLIGKVYVEALIISYGNGSNGKSTFWNSIAKVLGTYSGMMSAEILTVGYKQNVKPEIAEAKGKRLLIAAEMEESVRLSTSNVKKLCSTDPIKGEKKYKDPFDYTPSHTLVLYTNHLPKVGAKDNGTWRRLIVIPFDAKIRGTKKNYGDYLYNHAGGAILKWAIDGANKVIEDNYNLKLPTKVQAAIDAYKETNDWFGAFVEECCETDNSYIEKSGDLYAEYRAYCMRLGEFARGTIEFYNTLELEGFERKRTNKGSIVQGLRIKSEFLS